MVAYPKIVVSPPGPKARELVQKDERFVSPSYLRYYPLVRAKNFSEVALGYTSTNGFRVGISKGRVF